jgi:hypothetical protein
MKVQSFPCSVSATANFRQQFSHSLERQAFYVAFAVVVVGSHYNIADHLTVVTENVVVVDVAVVHEPVIVVVVHLCQGASLSACLLNQEEVHRSLRLGPVGRYLCLWADLLLGWRVGSHPRTPRPPSW